jgi:3-deoxy-7-phosphoheptulonate synthase
MNMVFKRELFNPQEVKEMYPLSEEALAVKRANDKEIHDVLGGSSDKLLLVIGPCSADREDAVLDYIGRLRPVQDRVKDKVVIIPRIYTNKPRTTGAGYKGMLHQPNPIANPDILKGLLSIRRMHVKAINEFGFSCADEMLYPENHHFLSDLLSYVAVGARSVEDQQHRLTASGLDVPVGMKNGKANITEFNESKNNYLRAESDLVQARYEQLYQQALILFYRGQELKF